MAKVKRTTSEAEAIPAGRPDAEASRQQTIADPQAAFTLAELAAGAAVSRAALALARTGRR